MGKGSNLTSIIFPRWGGDQNQQAKLVESSSLNRKKKAGDPVQKNGKHVVQLAVHEKRERKNSR